MSLGTSVAYYARWGKQYIKKRAFGEFFLDSNFFLIHLRFRCMVSQFCLRADEEHYATSSTFQTFFVQANQPYPGELKK